jgi:hypothetical protein
MPSETPRSVWRLRLFVLFGLPFAMGITCLFSDRRNKKTPVFQRKTGGGYTVIFTVFHRRPIVKRVQARLLTLGSTYRAWVCSTDQASLPLPAPTSVRTVATASFVPDYSGVAVPDFHGVPF